MLKSVLGLVVIGSVLATPAMAAGDGQGFFGSNSLRLGAGIGQNYVEIDRPGGADFDEHGTALEVFAGYEFNRWLALEAGYLNGEDATEEYFDGAIRVETSGVYATAVGSLPVSEYLSFYGRAGLVKWDSEVKVSIDGVRIARGEDDGTDPLFGVGAAVEVEGAQVRLEYRIADLNDADVSLISLSIVWRIPLGK